VSRAAPSSGGRLALDQPLSSQLAALIAERLDAGAISGMDHPRARFRLGRMSSTKRRDTDRLDITLDIERKGSIASIPLVEIRR